MLSQVVNSSLFVVGIEHNMTGYITTLIIYLIYLSYYVYTDKQEELSRVGAGAHKKRLLLLILSFY